MDHVDSFWISCYVNDSMLVRLVDADLYRARADGWHRSPVGWLRSNLYKIKLVASLATGLLRELLHSAASVSYPKELFH